MSWATSEIVAVLAFLLPGFVGAAAFYSLTSYPKPSEFDRVVQALVFTTVGQAIAWLIQVLTVYEWPSRPPDGHFRVTKAVWLDEEQQSSPARVVAILVPARDVEVIEFVQF